MRVIDYRKGLMAYTVPAKGQLVFKGVVGPSTKATDVFIADDKLVTENYARQAGLNIPESQLFSDQAAAEEFLRKNAPIVVKPADSAHGQGVSMNIQNTDQLKEAITRAGEYADDVLLQKQVSGDNLRLLFFGENLQAAAIRKPAEVKGDGQHNLVDLIEAENKGGKRAPDYLLPLNLIDHEAAKLFLGQKINDVPQKDETVQVVGTANIGTGGYAIDVTDEIEPSIVEQASNLIRSIGIEISGVDFIWDKQSNKAYFIEINASPSFGLHVYPAVGKSRPLAKNFLDWVEDRLASTGIE